MARSIWSGMRSFGLVSIPVRLYAATGVGGSGSIRALCGLAEGCERGHGDMPKDC
jgi:hypothetical protein